MSLILERRDLIIDLLQRASRLDDVLRIVARVVDDLRRRGPDRYRQRQQRQGHRGGKKSRPDANMFGGHDVTSTLVKLGMRSAAHSKPRSASQVSTKASRPNSASTRSIAT